MPYALQSEILPDNNGSEKLCAICHETLKDPSKAVFKLQCGHLYHNDCLHGLCNSTKPPLPVVRSQEAFEAFEAEWVTRCPLCRTPFSSQNCTTFDTFKSGHLYINSKPPEIKNIYYTLHPHRRPQEGGKRRRNKSKRNHKKGKRGKRKTIRRK